MDLHAREFYKESSEEFPDGVFRKVIALHESPDISWEDVQQKGFKVPRGWFELSKLSTEDRINFTKDFWFSKMPYHPKLQVFVDSFFSSLDDVGIFVTQKHFEDEYVVNMIYSVANNGGFFKGCEPASEESIAQLQQQFLDFIFPNDYLAFLSIHNGFRKATDKTGVFKSIHMQESYQQFQKMLEAMDKSITTDRGTEIDPKTLVPFYESFGMPFFQCFWSEWYPQNVTGMGNVYFSKVTKTISDPLIFQGSPSLNMSFTTFSDWLMFYLERID